MTEKGLAKQCPKCGVPRMYRACLDCGTEKCVSVCGHHDQSAHIDADDFYYCEECEASHKAYLEQNWLDFCNA